MKLLRKQKLVLVFKIRWAAVVLLALVGVQPLVKGPQAGSESAVRDLVDRVLPGRGDAFVLETIPAGEGGRDVFEIASRDGKVVLRGSSGVAMASGLNWCFKYHCNTHVSWCGNRLDLPESLPMPADAERHALQVSLLVQLLHLWLRHGVLGLGALGEGAGFHGAHLIKRHHDRWNRKCLLQSQGGTVGTPRRKQPTLNINAHHALPD